MASAEFRCVRSILESEDWDSFVEAVEAAYGSVEVLGDVVRITLPDAREAEGRRRLERNRGAGRKMSLNFVEGGGLTASMTASEVLKWLESHDTESAMKAMGCSQPTVSRRTRMLRDMPDDMKALPIEEAMRATYDQRRVERALRTDD